MFNTCIFYYTYTCLSSPTIVMQLIDTHIHTHTHRYMSRNNSTIFYFHFTAGGPWMGIGRVRAKSAEFRSEYGNVAATCGCVSQTRVQYTIIIAHRKQ